MTDIQALAPLGEPSRHLGRSQKRAWRKFKAELPWLTEADRALVDMAAVERHALADGTSVAGHVAAYVEILAQLGATPVGRLQRGV